MEVLVWLRGEENWKRLAYFDIFCDLYSTHLEGLFVLRRELRCIGGLRE